MEENMKRKFLSLCLALLLTFNILALAACGGGTPGGETPGGETPGGETPGGETPGGETPGGEIPEKCTVSFEGAAIEATTVDKGSSLKRPADPADKNNSRFVNWYLDAAYTTPASFPLTVNSDTKLYAKYMTYGDFFLMARDNTVGDAVSGFEYNYTYQISGTVAGISVNGTQTGVSKYADGKDVSYFDHRTNSGLLFNDGEIYEYKKGQTNNHLELDEDGRVIDFTSETLASAKKYDSSSFAKALFTYKSEDIKSISKDGNAYIIKGGKTLSGLGDTILNNVNHPLVEKALGELPDTSAETSVKVTFNGDKIATYEYNFTINVNIVTLQIKYTIDFKGANEIPTITLPTFENLYISADEINACLSSINSSINSYKAASASENTFKLQTAVDFGIKNSAINATYAGESKRGVTSGEVDFINLIEVDSDLKNNDLYGAQNLKDIKFVRGNLADGTIYDREKGMISYGDPVVSSATDRVKTDEYFLLLDNTFFSVGNIGSVSVLTKEGNKIYSLTLTKSGACAFLDYVNEYATLNPMHTSELKVLGAYDKNELSISEAIVTIKTDATTNSLISLDFDIECKSNVKYEGSRDFGTSARASIDVELEFTPKSAVSAYTAPESADDLKY